MSNFQEIRKPASHTKGVADPNQGIMKGTDTVTGPFGSGARSVDAL